MWLSDMSVRRPLVAVVISALLTVFGLVAFSKLTVREMPDVQTPSVSITTTYEGAAPEVMESQVTKPIEDQLSGISGIKNISNPQGALLHHGGVQARLEHAGGHLGCA